MCLSTCVCQSGSSCVDTDGFREMGGGVGGGGGLLLFLLSVVRQPRPSLPCLPCAESISDCIMPGRQGPGECGPRGVRHQRGGGLALRSENTHLSPQCAAQRRKKIESREEKKGGRFTIGNADRSMPPSVFEFWVNAKNGEKRETQREKE